MDLRAKRRKMVLTAKMRVIALRAKRRKYRLVAKEVR